MSRNNHPFQVLVTTGNADVLDPNVNVESLAVGQIGVFDAETNVSLDENSKPRNIYLAVGVDKTGGSTLNSINKSAGQKISLKDIKSYTYRAHTAARPQILDFAGYTANCDENYAIRLEFENAKIRKRIGYNQFSHTYAIKSGDCTGCEGCPSGDCVAVTEAMVNAINADDHGFVDAVAISPKTGSILVTGAPSGDGDVTFTHNGTAITVALLAADTAGDAAVKIAAALTADSTFSGYTVAVDTTTAEKVNITANGGADDTLTFVDTDTTNTAVTIVEPAVTEVTDYVAWKAANPSSCLGIRMTTNSVAIDQFCSIPVDFYKPLQTTIIPSAKDGFIGNGSFVDVQEAVYEEGDGRVVQQLEYRAGGFNGKPGVYKVSETTGLPAKGFRYFADAAVKYDLISLQYDQEYMGGFQQFKTPRETIIAIPETDTTTIAALLTVLDAMVPTGFDALTDDAAAANADPAVVERTQDHDDVSLDGIS